jgi:hypothetical protein
MVAYRISFKNLVSSVIFSVWLQRDPLRSCLLDLMHRLQAIRPRNITTVSAVERKNSFAFMRTY